MLFRSTDSPELSAPSGDVVVPILIAVVASGVVLAVTSVAERRSGAR